MTNYELTYILRPVEEANLTAANTRINTIVANAGGEIVHRNDWGRRRLAYPIRKINDGYYTTLFITLPGSAVRGVERSLQLMDDVMRYLVVRVETHTVPAAPATPAAPTAQAPATEPATTPAPAATAAQPAAAQPTAEPQAAASTVQAEQTETTAAPAATGESATTQAPTPESA